MRLKEILYLCKMKIIIAILVMFVASINMTIKGKASPTKNSEPAVLLSTPGINLSLKDSLILEVKKYNFKYPDVVVAQALEEAGAKLNSNIASKNNNLFGMKVASSRLAISKRKAKNGYADYHHWKESLIDRALYEAVFLRKLPTKESYYSYLGRNYGGGDGYIIRLKKLAKSVEI